jgi:hypothetical protein
VNWAGRASKTASCLTPPGRSEFDVLVTSDKKIPYQQNFKDRKAGARHSAGEPLANFEAGRGCDSSTAPFELPAKFRRDPVNIHVQPAAAMRGLEFDQAVVLQRLEDVFDDADRLT